ncbi:DNA polymerase III subunit gamma/tau [Gordoniibacillus kamchatkensis]|uniref:DNA-directed DNA polymerase n=1 Tax=Gordoniibacillus kamchatkensis TaxID=1590651 RepID=A0ABR5ACA9_9BACL|nr:DNA polymerase III subunit gamma/tau [Paenibacillus sp. VKM B-2647]KIL38601.1 DNA polymerase III subunit gamma/tau [Paenibacillus sp. VKM B-2647]
MAHIALYRTYRSQSFAEVVGQKHIVQTLQNSLREKRLNHAYLFSGPRGTGKTSVARILAKAVNCERGPAEEPCNECAACRRITEGAVMDVVEIDAASNRGVEEIRDIRDKVKYAPTEVRQKVYIIDEVHMLTTEAFNALLKTLEEPPAHVMFILATTESHRLPATIISRCQRYDFRRVPLEEQVGHIRFIAEKEGIRISDEALHQIARLSDGGMRDALSLLDQIIAFSGEQVELSDVLSITGGLAGEQFERLVTAMRERDIGTSMELVDAFMQEGKSADKCMESLIQYFRDLLVVRMLPQSKQLTERIWNAKQLAEVAAPFSPQELMRIIETLNHYLSEMKYSVQPQTLFEVAIMKACTADLSAAAGAETAAALAAAGAGADSAAVMELTRKVQRLEEQLQKLLQSGVAAGVAEAGAPAGRASASGRAGASAAAPIRKSSVKLQGFLPSVGTPELRAVLSAWNNILTAVKERKITVHAWLVDGEPVGVQDDTVLLAFKSAMHRDTTEKPANRQLIEQVMSEMLGKPTQFATVMMKEWKDAQSSAADAQAPQETMRLEHEDEIAARPKEEWISEAIQLFGDNLVSIQDD